MSSKRVVSKGAKNLLKNTIQSTDFYNKKKEEELMWKIHQEQSHGTKREFSNESDSDSEDLNQNKNSSANFGRKKYWMKKLTKEEEKQPDRWGHSGYKELYPEEFDESSSDFSEKKPKKKKTNKTKNKKKKSKKKHKRKKSK